MAFQSEDIRHLGKLAKLHLSEDEVNLFQKEINAIFEVIQHLNTLDVSRVAPLYQVNGENNRTDADIVHASQSVQAIRSAFPEDSADHHLVVHAVFAKK